MDSWLPRVLGRALLHRRHQATERRFPRANAADNTFLRFVVQGSPQHVLLLLLPTLYLQTNNSHVISEMRPKCRPNVALPRPLIKQQQCAKIVSSVTYWDGINCAATASATPLVFVINIFRTTYDFLTVDDDGMFSRFSLSPQAGSSDLFLPASPS